MLLIDIDKHVRIVFKNGTVIEGIVKEWSDSQVQLQSLNDESIIIVTHPDDDIMLVKILVDNPMEDIQNPNSLQEEIRTKIKEVEIVPQTDEQVELQQKSISELRKMVLEQDKKLIQEKIRKHFPSLYAPHKPNYGSQIDVIPSAVKRKS